MEQTLDEIDASVATPHKRSIQVVRCSRKTVAYTVLSQWASFDVGTCLVQAPVPTALLVCNADVSLSNFKPNTHRRRDATVELSRVGVGVAYYSLQVINPIHPHSFSYSRGHYSNLYNLFHKGNRKSQIFP